ncbi:hypothetical protein [Actinoplanes sp. NBRC 103695]|uniref:hypothetical protein n=1 Tax=Actinoplanes sp. NBRC 103695 TaxID=3032202 RepID=UPI0024A1772D|nr:hypothetical protein [Actinoplanes sp. NBRC 103695]GLZ00039.1 hypothetical protein Acsp02_72910 [Actinoplanes sp. NBRC 103695]
MTDLRAAIGRYAERFHTAVGNEHHVASPLGAWLLLALAASAAPGDERLADALGMAPEEAARSAEMLLKEPHPLVAAATAVWHTHWVLPEAMADWRDRLPVNTEVGALPDQAGLDRWASDHTYGMIERFPITITPDVALVLGSALATKVTWQAPFELGAPASLGPRSPWAGQVTEILRSPETHRAFIAESRSAGRVAVHIAAADGGLEVMSVAAAPDVAPARVIAAAHEELSPLSLYDLPLGETDLWNLREVQSTNPGSEDHQAFLPAWSVTSQHDLSAPGLGFGAVADVLAPLLRVPPGGFQAAQSATARYDRYGFEAAAVSGFALMAGAAHQQTGVARTADLRFGHPYAVIAVASPHEPGPWHRLPVFSAWVASPR